MENIGNELLDAKLTTDNIKKEISEKRTKRGFKLMALGAIVLLSGCITNLIMPCMNDTYNYVLYGVTSTGATIVFYGLYCVLE
jgi:bacteriorhodopsin